jgi:hypothetical protein
VLFGMILACALLARMMVPAGFMPSISGNGLVLAICSGTMPAPAMANAGHHGMARHDAPAGAPKAEQPCAFAGLGSPALAAADPLLLTAALAFAFLLAVRGAVQQTPIVPARLRPPLRAPPA